MLNSRFVFLFTFLFLISFSLFAADSRILKLPIKTGVLANGLKVTLVKYPSVGVVAYQLPVHAGSRNEIEKGKTGFAHFFEHLMFRGTKKRSAEEFGALYAKLGCENNAWTSYDMTNYHGVVAKVYLKQILEAEADRFADLKFDEKQLRDEAGAVLGEYNKDVAQPEFLVEEKLMSTAFSVHPYSHTTMGFKEDVLKFTERYQDVWPFFRRYYRPSNVSVLLVGDVDLEKDYKMVEALFSKWAPADQAVAPVIPVEPEQNEARQASVQLDKPTQTRLAIAFKSPAFSTKNTDSAALSLLSELFFGVTSDFQKTYRYEKKWFDSIYLGSGESLDPGLWTIQLRLSKEGEGNEAALVKAIEDTLAHVSDLKKKRLVDVKRQFRNLALTRWFSSPDALAGQLAVYMNFESDPKVLDRIFERIDSVEVSDLNRVAQKYLTKPRQTIVTLTGK